LASAIGFVLAEGDNALISDLVCEEVRDHLVDLTDGVAVRTTNWIDSRVESFSMRSRGIPYAPEPAFGAVVEFEAYVSSLLRTATGKRLDTCTTPSRS